MSINKVEYIPNQSFNNSSPDNSEQEAKKIQQQKWRVLFGTFIIIAVLANTWIWTRPPVFESQAILHFSFPSQTELEFSQVAERKVEAHQQKLLSNSVLQTVSQALMADGYAIAAQDKQKMFKAEVSGRLITLSVEHTERQILQPVLETWLSNYLELESSEKQKNNSEEMDTANLQLLAIKEKIAAKQQELSLFAEANDITSLERDENRILNKIKSLSANLDAAIAEQTSAQALLNSLRQSVKKGQPIIRDIDKAQINSTKQNIQLLKSELVILEEKYTQAYLARDPSIVRKQESLDALEKSLIEQLAESKSYYLQDAERDLEAANDRVELTKEQFKSQNQQAQAFNQKLQEYKIINSELSAIQEQAQTIRTHLVKQEVSQPFDAKISVLEAPFTPDFASGPDYWYMTIISLLAATGAGVFALLLFGYIVKQKQPNQAATNFVVMPGQTVNRTLEQLTHEQQALLQSGETNLRINQQDKMQPSPLRLLSAAENQALYAAANKQGKALLALVYSGLNLSEISILTKTNFTDNFSKILVSGEYARTLTLSKSYISAIKDLCELKSDADSIWSNINSENDLLQILANSAHDAEINNPEQVDVRMLRHCFITYLVAQGAKLNDLEQIVGYVSLSDLAQYRTVQRQGKLLDLADIDLNYPLRV
ncbi:tyrosine-type recombinase/integrase [Paraglaciecola sp. L3A3]|uniref:tyrosine-type recombinase/integrase n=1 Tax=Paraglaciecola sp. L3A3 TaxID=2686358 RepID=UPI00131ACADE|nr:tyrosine-type recombinase/integrase [Paraglaciecola sp. L3A3]